MKLYYARGTIAIAVAIALHEAGLEFEPVRLDFKAGEQTRPDYHAINPKGRVPALVTDSGILTETAAILDHIADPHLLADHDQHAGEEILENVLKGKTDRDGADP